MCILFQQTICASQLIVLAGGVALGQPGGNAQVPQHHRHTGGVIITIALLLLEKEVVGRILIGGRARNLIIVFVAAHIRLDCLGDVIGIVIALGDLLSQIENALGHGVGQLQIALGDVEPIIGAVAA